MDFKYRFVIDYPTGFYRPRIAEELLEINGTAAFSRKLAAISLSKKEHIAEFSLDWHMAALPVVQVEDNDPIAVFRNWMKKMILIEPCPQLMDEKAAPMQFGETLDLNAKNYISWLSSILARMPQVYSCMDSYIREIMPDLKSLNFDDLGNNIKKLSSRFEHKGTLIEIPWEKLSQGEKIIIFSSTICALAESQDETFCFWDEPDNYQSSSLLNCFIMKLRSLFDRTNGQLLITSHNLEIINGFNYRNTYVFRKSSHTETTLPLESVQELKDKQAFHGDLTLSVLTGDLFHVGE